MWKVLDKIEEYLCAGMLSVMAALTFANVLVRYLTNASLAFTEELVVNLFVWVTMFGGAIAFRKGAHLGVSVLTNMFPTRLQKAVVILSAVCGVALFAILFKEGVGLVSQEYKNQMTTYSMGLPMWWFGLAVPTGALICLLRVVWAATNELRSLSQDK
ncbi:MAG: TRAP transporter small permease [Firmicutes bacterium]|jgi:TRAP-type C4-dicarboxylate transport system permease small subunit|nr:TRAP transporter small permease [Bacillota bacterium]